MPDFGLRLRCFDATTGTERGLARAALVERYARAGEPGALRLNFSELAPRSELFAQPVEIAVECYDGTTWHEGEDARYVVALDGHERTADPSRSHDLTLVGVGSLLAGPKVFTAPPEETQTDGKRQFLSKTPGQIMGTLIAEAQGRGATPTLTVGFTATHDSNGQPWGQVYNRAYELNHSLLGILQNLHDGGAVDYWWDGRELNMVPAGDRGRDLSLGLDPVYLRDLYAEASPERHDWTRLADSVLLIGDEGASFAKTSPTAFTPFGRRETVILAGGVSDEGTATVMMDRALAEGADVARELTREWAWHPEVRWMPDRDLRVGDWVLADTAVGTRQRVKIADLMCRQGPDGIEAFVTLGTVADDLLTRMAKRQLGIEGGAGVGSIGTPTPAPPPDPTDRWPERPTGLTVDVSAWPIPGGYGAVIGADWDEVTVDTGGFAMDVDGYILRARRQGGPWLEMFRTSSLTGQAERTDMRPGETWEAQVAAYWGARTGIWSTLWTGEVPEDIQAPPVPSASVLESPVGQLVVAWDGLTSTGSSMPLDLKVVEIELNGLTDPEHWKIGSNGGSHRFDPPAVQIGTMYTVRLRAVDHAGNASEWSSPAFSGITATVAWPASPPSVLASADTYLTAEGAYRGRISASWGEVTEDGEGNPLAIAGYAVRVRRTIGPFAVDWFDLGGTPALSLTGSSALMEVGDTWEVAVAAVSTDGHTGPFSTPQSVVIPPDSVAPQAPSKPVATTGSGMLTVEWDGLSQSGGGMDLDTAHALVHLTGLSETWPMDLASRVVHIGSGDGQPLTVGVAYEVRLSAVDRAGNESALSQPADSVSVASVLTDTDWAAQMAKITTWGTNLYPDAGYTDDARNALRESAGLGFTIANGTIQPDTTSAQQAWLTPTGEVAGANASNAEFVQGRTYVVEAIVDARPGASAEAAAVVRNPSDGTMAWVETGLATIPAGGQLVLSRVWTCDDPAKQLGLWVTGQPWVRSITVQERTRSVLIEDDAVTAGKVFMDEGFAQKLTAALGVFDGVTAGWVSSNMITADAINGKLFTGSKFVGSIFTTNNTPDRGIWINGEDNTIKSFNLATGQEEFRVASGDVRITGRFQTRGAYPHFDLARGLWADFAGMQWTIGPGWQTRPEIITNASKWGDDLAGGLYVRGGNRDGLTMRPEVALRSGRTISGTDSFWPSVDIVLGLGATTHGRRRLRDEGTNTTSIYDWADFVTIETKTGQALRLNVPSSPGDILLASSTGAVDLRTGNGWFRTEGIGSTGGGEDLALEGDWRVAYRASLSEFKLDQQPIRPLYELLEIPAKTWVDRGRRELDPAWDVRYSGVVYEDVAAVSEAHGGSLEHLLIKRGGKPSSIAYNALAANLIPVIADMERRLSLLEAPRRAA